MTSYYRCSFWRLTLGIRVFRDLRDTPASGFLVRHLCSLTQWKLYLLPFQNILRLSRYNLSTWIGNWAWQEFRKIRKYSQRKHLRTEFELASIEHQPVNHWKYILTFTKTYDVRNIFLSNGSSSHSSNKNIEVRLFKMCWSVSKYVLLLRAERESILAPSRTGKI